MPYCQVDDKCRIYYQIHSTDGKAFTGKPVLLVLEPLYFDLEAPCMKQMLQNEELLAKFDMLCFDFRGHGLTQSEATPLQDAWTPAGDALVLLRELHINAVHILAGHAVASDCALRLAALSPKACLSMTLCGVSRQNDTDSFNQALGELFSTLSSPTDIEDWYEAVEGAYYFNFTSTGDKDFQNEYGKIYCERYPPNEPLHGWKAIGWWFNRCPIPSSALSKISAPMTILYGTEDTLYPDAYETLLDDLENVEPKVICLEGAPHNVFKTRSEEVIYEVLAQPLATPTATPISIRDSLRRLQHIAEVLACANTAHTVLAVAGRPEVAESFNLTCKDKIAVAQREIAHLTNSPPEMRVASDLVWTERFL